MKIAAAMFVAVLFVPTASADRWRDTRDRDRKIHLAVTLGAGLIYLSAETVLQDAISPDQCRWCDPPSFDVRVRDALRWNDVESARTASDLIGHVAIPALALAVPNLTLVGGDAGFGDVLDVTLPILETVFLTQSITSFAKGAFGRQRPLVHFSATPIAPAAENNLSFWSGHTSLAFAFVTSAGMVAHRRGSRAAPAIWGVGMTLAASTGYFRIAGDKHYLSDVLMGATVGIGLGLTIPRFIEEDLAVTSDGTSIALVGAF